MIKQQYKLFAAVLLLLTAAVAGNSCMFMPKDDEEKVSKDGMDLVWSDDFDNYTGCPDSSKWKYQTGAGGWGNNEEQNYTDNSATADTAKVMTDSDGNGILRIRAYKDNGSWKSARLNSKQSFKYGLIEARLKVTDTRGAWPAFWMMPTDSAYGTWPASGEIDIMENAPSSCGEHIAFSTLHAQGHYGGDGTHIGKASFGDSFRNEWHTFAIEWNENTITAYYDDVKQNSYVNDGKGSNNWPYDKEFYIILNLAIGGNLGNGNTNDSASLTEAVFDIDYVRVYQ